MHLTWFGLVLLYTALGDAPDAFTLNACRPSPFVMHNNFGGGFGEYTTSTCSVYVVLCELYAIVLAAGP